MDSKPCMYTAPFVLIRWDSPRVTNILKTCFVFHVPCLSHPYEGQHIELLYIYYDATTHYQ